MDDPEIGDVPDTGTLRVLSREELESEIRERTAQLQNVMDTMADVLVTLDPQGRIEMANAAVEEILGYDPESVEGRPIAFLFATAGRDGETAVAGAEFVDRLVTEGRVTDLEVPFETADGREIPMQLSASIMREDGAVTGYVCVARDITERKERERKLERKNEFLDEFASVVSHDIATPLGVIENKAQLIEITGDPGHTDEIFEATDRIQSLIDDLLTLARKGKQVDETELVALDRVANQAWRSIDAADATMTVESAERVEASPGRLRQLLENLMRNAIEHGPADAPVRVRVGTTQDPEGFFVADDGPGIPEAEREQVFERGYTTGDRNSGLGLAIVHRVVEGHGWTIDVAESESGGARFEIRTGS
jgi:PAS domain S-box-containing protein